MKRVVAINHLMEPPGRITGISRYLFSLLGELAREEAFDCRLFTCWSAGALRPHLPDGIAIHTLPFIRTVPGNLLHQSLRFPALARQAGAAIEFNPSPLGQTRGPLPRVIVVHDLYLETAPELFGAAARFWWRRFFPASLAAANRIICVSRQTEADLLAAHPAARGRTRVIHEAPCLLPAVPRIEKSAPGHGLIVANMSPNKNAPAIVAAVLEARRRGLPLRLLHVGRDEAGSLAPALARSPDDAGIVPLGAVDDARLSTLYAEAGYLLCLSRQEGFCLPVLEAQAHGTPVIASDIPVLREVGGDGCLFVDPADPAAVIAAAASLAPASPLAGEMAGRARANAARFSWRRAAQETAALFSEILEGPDQAR